MPQVLLSESLKVEYGAKDPWPDNVSLYKPFESEQMLLPDTAACLSVEAFLNMCKLPFYIERRKNAEDMSPTGRVPFIHAGAFLVAELDPIVAFVSTKKISLTTELDTTQKSDLRAYMSLANNVLGCAELYVSWLHTPTYENVTQARFGSAYAWPLNVVLVYLRRRQVFGKLKVLKWKEKTMDEVCNEVNLCCIALSERLDKQNYFFGNKPTELDAVVFGHLFSLITTPLPESRLASVVRKHDNLTRFCQRIDNSFFKDPFRASSNGSGNASAGSSSANGDEYDKLEDLDMVK